jgi:hypothetical protein
MHTMSVEPREPEVASKNPPDLLTIQESAMMLRCSKAHVSNLLAGKVSGVPALPYVPLGRRKLIQRATLTRWMQDVEVVAKQ